MRCWTTEAMREASQPDDHPNRLIIFESKEEFVVFSALVLISLRTLHSIKLTSVHRSTVIHAQVWNRIGSATVEENVEPL
jgi:hypothetical protein